MTKMTTQVRRQTMKAMVEMTTETPRKKRKTKLRKMARTMNGRSMEPIR